MRIRETDYLRRRIPLPQQGFFEMWIMWYGVAFLSPILHLSGGLNRQSNRVFDGVYGALVDMKNERWPMI